jgi:DNA polymerase III delta subunit
MKIIVLHGDHLVESENRLQRFIKVAKKRNWEVERIIDNSKDIPEVLVSENLFGKKKLVIVEAINLINKKNSNWLEKNRDLIDTSLVVYNQGKISKTSLRLLPNPNSIEEFNLPKLIWSFFDSFYPGNCRNCLKLLKEIIKDEPIELIFALLARHLRSLYWIKIEGSGPPVPTWRLAKLKRQASKFTTRLLKKIVFDLANADIKAKTSQMELSDSLDFIIATKLE